MLVYNFARAAGKTTAIVDHAIKHNLDILVFSLSEKRRLLGTYADLKQDQVFTIDEANSRKGYRNYNGTVIDNLDLILENLLSKRVNAVSLTTPMILMHHTGEHSNEDVR